MCLRSLAECGRTCGDIGAGACLQRGGDARGESTVHLVKVSLGRRNTEEVAATRRPEPPNTHFMRATRSASIMTSPSTPFTSPNLTPQVSPDRTAANIHSPPTRGERWGHEVPRSTDMTRTGLARALVLESDPAPEWSGDSGQPGRREPGGDPAPGRELSARGQDARWTCGPRVTRIRAQ